MKAALALLILTSRFAIAGPLAMAAAYSRIKQSTGRDPSVFAVSAEIGLNLLCAESD